MSAGHAAVVTAVFWGVVVVVWIVGAIYNGRRAPRPRARGPMLSPKTLALVVVVLAATVVLVHFYGKDLIVTAGWVRVVGLVLLGVSSAFTVWARFALGTMWSIGPIAKDDHQLRTDGPYAVTRHPIYTGLLGMLFGTTLLNGIGPLIVLVPVGFAGMQLKIRLEEQLMLDTFPDEYPRYRRRVPQLIPLLFAGRGPGSPGSSGDRRDSAARGPR